MIRRILASIERSLDRRSLRISAQNWKRKP